MRTRWNLYESFYKKKTEEQKLKIYKEKSLYINVKNEFTVTTYDFKIAFFCTFQESNF